MKNLLYRLNFVVLLCSIGFSSWAQLGISPVKSIKLTGYLGKRVDHLLTQVGTGTGVDIVNTGAHRGMPSITIIEPVILLYNRTKEQRYLDFANSIMKLVETADGPQLISKAISGVPVSKRFPFPKPWFGRGNGSKAYEMMECYLSMLELYKITNNTVYLYAAERTAASIIEDEINIVGTGGAGESWVGGKKKQTIPTIRMMETCDASTLVRLCLCQ